MIHIDDKISSLVNNTLFCGTYRTNQNKMAYIDNIVYADRNTLIYHDYGGFNLTLNNILADHDRIRLTWGKYDNIRCGDLLIFQGHIKQFSYDSKTGKQIMEIADYPKLLGIIRVRYDYKGDKGFTLHKVVIQNKFTLKVSQIDKYSESIYDLLFSLLSF